MNVYICITESLMLYTQDKQHCKSALRQLAKSHTHKHSSHPGSLPRLSSLGRELTSPLTSLYSSPKAGLTVYWGSDDSWNMKVMMLTASIYWALPRCQALLSASIDYFSSRENAGGRDFSTLEMRRLRHKEVTLKDTLVGRIMPPSKDNHVLIPGNYKRSCRWQRGLCRCD